MFLFYLPQTFDLYITNVFNIDHFLLLLLLFWVENQHIKMISEGSCDTEDWSDAENSALPSQE